MKLYLIRHGETVDNVAGLYAGVRDSALTNHGVDQARRLGEYFAKDGVKLTHIFASPLSRASKTAEAVRTAQPQPASDGDNAQTKSLKFVRVPQLIEQDFGYYEGKPFYTRSDPKKTGRESHLEKHKSDPGFVDVESKESMAKRADAFLDQHLMPLFDEEPAGTAAAAMVSHGILLSNLWRRLLLRLPRKSLTIAPEITASNGTLVLEHLGGWSNTGYLELFMSKDSAVSEPASAPVPSLQAASEEVASLPTPIPLPGDREGAAVSLAAGPPGGSKPSEPAKAGPRVLHGWSTTILAIDSKQHLVSLKRQRGGIGRLAHDEGQKKLDVFFKRQKTS
ncbi:hypothetical protein LTR36_008977 [Oleoguttula mirabilis]|uniref:Phosphoglycerate mutase n=1 Tax=Oleoguttula mirabilis TaxID=1507867 RepID=A0AAV9J7G9_9PEZI|nr:hypothetical protein LTR36_008977 [Oleoguttula mirabilis]